MSEQPNEPEGEWEDCYDCAGDGAVHDCGEDCCCCADPDGDLNEDCDTCGGKGGWWRR